MQNKTPLEWISDLALCLATIALTHTAGLQKR